MTVPTVPALHFIGNHPALDFLNSTYGTGDKSCDCLTDDASALAWLRAAGQLSPDLVTPPAGLATLARSLRQAASLLIESAKSGQPGDPAVVNDILAKGQPSRLLALDGAGKFVFTEQRRDASAASLLEPIATAVARLLAEGNLALVRQCEAHDCTLQFLDITKSGRRRWCSMAVCGNRMKVAAFRSRKDAH